MSVIGFKYPKEKEKEKEKVKNLGTKKMGTIPKVPVTKKGDLITRSPFYF
jgi:hypothetical protein